MYLAISTTHRPATDLGFLLHKHPDRTHEVELSFGRALVCYPEAGDERCTAVLILAIDAVGLVRGAAGLQDQYVNDRPYAASSFLSVALGKAFGTAMSGRSKLRRELADQPIPLEATVTPLACRGREGLAQVLWEPLGYAVEAAPHPGEEGEAGGGQFVTLTVRKTGLLRDLLRHLSVLIPVLDNRKHYFVGQDEMEALLRRGEGWLAAHPEKELIVGRALRFLKPLTREALARLAPEDEPDPDAGIETKEQGEEKLEAPIRLNDLRLERVAAALAESNARRVLDLGCGSGKLLQQLIKNRQFEEIVGVDVSLTNLEITERRLKLDRMPEMQKKRLRLLQGALTYRDARLEGFDAAALVEVIEHLDLDRLGAMEQSLFRWAAPRMIVVTTPNREYNAKFPGLAGGKLRHPDHRFEWTRAEFEAWAERVAAAHGYGVRFEPIGELDAVLGAPTQMAVFAK
jgi:3' terminal RNA ribose 2'-O-methyltransferase Hen1